MKYNWAASANIYSSTLVDLALKNKDIFVVEADLMKASGTRIFKDKFPDRHINVGVAEQNLVGISAGLAAMGRIPFAFAMANFISQRACDQVTISVSYNNFNVKLVGGFAGLSQGKNGGTHISIMDIAIIRNLPNVKILVPSDSIELSYVLSAALNDFGPTYIRMSRFIGENIFDRSYKFEIGKIYQIGNGKDLTIASTGISTVITLKALDLLNKEGINARLIHIPTIKPIDSDLIIKCAKETGLVITVEDHSISGGLGGLITEILSETYPVPIFRIGLENKFGLTADLEFQLDYFGISVENILRIAKKILKK